MQLSDADQLVGRTLGEYQVERLLGQGPLGAAYLAQQFLLGRTVMITTFAFPEGIADWERDQFTARFTQEGQTLVELTHPNILPIYDFGIQPHFFYLVNSFVKGASLNQVLKQQGRFTPQQTLDVLKQIAAGLDYAHSKGLAHGILNISNILMDNDLQAQIAGFGLRTMLKIHGNTQQDQPLSSFLRSNSSILGNPEYISPERLLGKPVDARSDIYTLGVILFELLSGIRPLSGTAALDIALQRVQHSIPSVHTVCPDVPAAFDLMISKALERDPAKRYQRAGDMVVAFERALNVLGTAPRTHNSSFQQSTYNSQITLPPTVNWFDETGMTPSFGRSTPSTPTGYLPAATSPFTNQMALTQGDNRQTRLPREAAQPDSLTEMLLANDGLHPPTGTSRATTGSLSTTSARHQSLAPGTFIQKPPVRSNARPRTRQQIAQQDRRKLVTLIATGTTITGVLAVSGISLAHLLQAPKQSQAPIAGVSTTGVNTPTTVTGKGPATSPTQGAQKTPTTSQSPAAKPSPAPTKGIQPTNTPPANTPPPTPTPRPAPPPGHTGTVIGATNMATNSSKAFSNPADGQGSLLIRLPSGKFVACERACTHEGVPVDYDPGSGMIVCPAHNAVFDPVNGFSHVSGPGGGALPTVAVRVNGDGTITTG